MSTSFLGAAGDPGGSGRAGIWMLGGRGGVAVRGGGIYHIRDWMER